LLIDEIRNWTCEMTGDRQKSDAEFLLIAGGYLSGTKNVEI
jgi:hypothetical protein